MILHTEFSLIRTTPWPDEKELFLKFSKVPNSRNSQNSVWKIIFFPRQAIPKFRFALHSHYTGDTPYRVSFDVDNSLPDEKDLFLKFIFQEIQKVPYEILTFFRTRYTIFLLITLITRVTLHIKFGLIWTIPWTDEKEIFLNSQIFAIREIRKSPYENPFFA